MTYVRTNAGHKGLKYKARAPKPPRQNCLCGKPRHRSKTGKLCLNCRTCQYKHERRWALKHPDRWRTHQLRSRLKRVYGLKLETYEGMLAMQSNRCAICGGEFKIATLKARSDMACVDHDHATKRVRAILCAICNSIIGLANDRAELLKSAAAYLEQHRG